MLGGSQLGVLPKLIAYLGLIVATRLSDHRLNINFRRRQLVSASRHLGKVGIRARQAASIFFMIEA